MRMSYNCGVAALHRETCGAGWRTFRSMMDPDSTVRNQRSQIRLDLAGRKVVCTPLPAAQQRRARSARPTIVVNDYGRGRGLRRGRGVGVTLEAGTVAVGEAVAVGVAVGVDVGVGEGGGVGDAITIAKACTSPL